MDGKKRFRDFINNLSQSDEVLIAYDKDGDGVPAGGIAKIALSRLNIDVELFPFDRAHIKDFIAHANHMKATKIIFFDVSAEAYSEIFTGLPDAKFMVVDHHKKYASPKGVVVIKPADLDYKKDPATYPAGKMSFDLFSMLTDITDLDWLACVSLISDTAHEYWIDFVDNTLKQKGWAKKDYYQSIPGQIAAVINTSNSIEESRITEAMELILTLDPDKILGSDLAKLSRELWKVIDKSVDDADKLGERLFGGKVVIFNLNSKYKIAGFVSTILSKKLKDVFVVIAQPHDRYMNVSARCQSYKIPVNKILEESVKDLNDSKAGGHIPAAGAHFLKKDFVKFRENLLSELKKYIKM